MATSVAGALAAYTAEARSSVAARRSLRELRESLKPVERFPGPLQAGPQTEPQADWQADSRRLALLAPSGPAPARVLLEPPVVEPGLALELGLEYRPEPGPEYGLPAPQASEERLPAEAQS